jgi:hypothetical protein
MHSQSRTFRQWTTCALLAALGSAPQAHAAVYSGSVISRANAVGFGTVIQPPNDATDQIAETPFGALNSSNEANQTWVDGSVNALAAGNSDSSSNTSTGALHLYANANADVSVAGIAANTNASGSSHAAGFFRDVLVFDVPNAAAGALYSVRAIIRIDAVNTSAGTLVDAATPSFSNASSEWNTRVSMASGAGWLFQQEGHARCSYLSHSIARETSPARPSCRSPSPIRTTSSSRCLATSRPRQAY